MTASSISNVSISTPSTLIRPEVEDDGIPEQHVHILTVVVGCVLSIMVIMAVTGNILVCVAIYTDRRLRKIGNLFVASLAVADLFVSSLVMTFAIANDLMGYWMFGSKFCDIWMSFDVMCSTASILNLCAISLDRYIHIKDPLRYETRVTKRTVTAAILSIWMIAAMISFLPISLGLHEQMSKEKPPAVEGDLPQCVMEFSPEYAIISSIISFYFPCVIMVILYSRLYGYAQKHVASIKAISAPIPLGSVDGVTLPPAPVSPVSEHKALITVGVVVGVFLVCWVPFFLINIVAAFCHSCIPDLVFKVLTWFGYFNSALNPIIYSIFNTEFREAFHKIIAVNSAKFCQDVCVTKSRREMSCEMKVTRNGQCMVRSSTSRASLHLNIASDV